MAVSIFCSSGMEAMALGGGAGGVSSFFFFFCAAAGRARRRTKVKPRRKTAARGMKRAGKNGDDLLIMDRCSPRKIETDLRITQCEGFGGGVGSVGYRAER